MFKQGRPILYLSFLKSHLFLIQTPCHKVRESREIEKLSIQPVYSLDEAQSMLGCHIQLTKWSAVQLISGVAERRIFHYILATESRFRVV
jgi:hypothetical protein